MTTKSTHVFCSHPGYVSTLPENTVTPEKLYFFSQCVRLSTELVQLALRLVEHQGVNIYKGESEKQNRDRDDAEGLHQCCRMQQRKQTQLA